MFMSQNCVSALLSVESLTTFARKWSQYAAAAAALKLLAGRLISQFYAASIFYVVQETLGGKLC